MVLMAKGELMVCQELEGHQESQDPKEMLEEMVVLDYQENAVQQ